MQTKALKYILAGVIILTLISGAFSSGILVGWIMPGKAAAASLLPTDVPAPTETPTLLPTETPQATPTPKVEIVTPTPDANGDTPTNLQTLFEPFWQTWQIIHQQFVDQPVDDVALLRGAIRGMLDALGDKHSGYMDPQEYLQATMPMEGEYDGIGAWVDTTQEFLTITSPMPGSPAEAAGLKPGDQIIKVDGEDMTGVDASIALQHVLGPAGTPVVLTIRREGVADPFDVEIVRAKINLPSAEGRMLDGNIAYIQITTFGDKTMPQLVAALNELMPQNPKGLIIDLRNNGGGLLVSAIQVASQFIGDGVIMYEQYGDGTRDTYSAIPGGLATDIPLVVLVNGGTASASEIVSGAIQDYNRGKLVGTTTYGKGSVQNWIELQDAQGAIRVTIARWLTPKERQINGVGLTPDYVVEITQEQVDAKQDPQLDKAIEVINSMQ